MALKAYYVDRISRCTVTMLVYAESAVEALRKAKEEDTQESNANYQHRGYGRPVRAPEEDPA